MMTTLRKGIRTFVWTGFMTVVAVGLAAGPAWSQGADLSITKFDSPHTVTPGETLTYVISVVNRGPDTAQNVQVTETLPAGVATTSGCDEDPTGTPTCTLGDIDSGSFVQYTITLIVDGSTQTGMITNTAAVTSDTDDPDLGNNSISEETTVATAVSVDTTLTDDLPFPLKIVSDNITLNCDGNVITGSNSGSGIFVENRTGVTIMNCTVVTFNHGIELDESTNITLKSNATIDNVESGIEINGADGNVVKHNITNSNGVGIALGGDFNTVNGNTVQNNNDGIRFSDGDSNVVMNNLVTENVRFGILLGDSRFNILKGNTSNDNGADGINVGDADNNILMKNWTEGNSGDGVLICARNNSIKKNTSVDNTGYGFRIPIGPCRETVPPNTFAKNKCTENDAGGSDPTGLCSPQP
jgi:uncharacterized repeat protein (TIGR01451 family)